MLGEHFALQSSMPQEPFGKQLPEGPTEPPSEMKQPLPSSPPGNSGTPANTNAGGGGANVGGVSTPAMQGGGGGGGSLSNPSDATLGTISDATVTIQNKYGNHPITTIYDTGVDNTGAPLADGATDPHYQLIAAPNGAGNASVVEASSFPLSPPSYWLANGDGASKWIGSVASEQNDTNGIYTYETTFDLSNYNAASAVLNGRYLADDWLDEIDLNGQVVASFTHGDTSQDAAWQTLPTIASGFVAGVNTLDFVTENRVQSTGNPNGFRVELTGTDDTLAWQGPTFDWTQTPTAAPTIATSASQTNTEGDTVSLQMSASDPNGNPLAYDAVNLPPGLSIDSATGLISGTVQNGAAADFDGSYTPTIIVANNQGAGTQTTFAWTIDQVQTAPTLDNPSDQTNLRGDTVSLQLNSTQVDNDALTYDAENLPTGLSIDSDTGIISGTVDPSAALNTPYAVTITTTDESTNLSTNQTFNWTIAATNTAPVLTAPGDQTNAAGDDI